MFSVRLKVKDDRNSLPRRSKKLANTTPSGSRSGSLSSLHTGSLPRSIISNGKSNRKDKKVRIFTTLERRDFNGRFLEAKFEKNVEGFLIFLGKLH